MWDIGQRPLPEVPHFRFCGLAADEKSLGCSVPNVEAFSNSDVAARVAPLPQSVAFELPPPLPSGSNDGVSEQTAGRPVELRLFLALPIKGLAPVHAPTIETERSRPGRVQMRLSKGVAMPGSNLDLLRDAIDRNAAVVVSFPVPGLARNYRSRFLKAQADAFWVESAPADRLLIRELLGSAQPIDLSFRNAGQTVSLTVPIRSHDPAFAINSRTRVEAILLPFPESVAVAQRRDSYRVRVPSSPELTVHAWRLAEQADLAADPSETERLAVRLRDISVGGIGLTLLGVGGAEPTISIEDRLRIELVSGSARLVLEGRLRAAPVAANQPGQLQLGVRFHGMERDILGRRSLAQLTRIVGDLQRHEARRSRLGLTATSGKA